MVFMAEAPFNPPEYYLNLEGVPKFDKIKNEWMNKCFEEMHRVRVVNRVWNLRSERLNKYMQKI